MSAREYVRRMVREYSMLSTSIGTEVESEEEEDDMAGEGVNTRTRTGTE